MIGLAIIRKQTDDGFFLVDTKLIIDRNGDSPLFLGRNNEIDDDIFHGEVDWDTVLEQACERGCPPYYTPDTTFSRESDERDCTTMIYPIPLDPRKDNLLRNFLDLSRRLSNDQLSETIKQLTYLQAEGIQGATIPEIINEITWFCARLAMLSIPVLIPFGGSESDFWESARALYVVQRNK